MYNILICYYGEYPARISNLDHLYSFGRYSGQRCFYLDLGVQRIPGYLLKIPFDLIIFHTNFLSARWDLHIFRRIVEKARPLLGNPAVKIAIPQDDFFCANVVCDFINEFDIRHIFSAAPPSEWKKIYKTVDFSKVQFHLVLTGYLDEQTLDRIDKIASKIPERGITIGYRAWRAEPWLGRHGFIKTRLAEIFLQKARSKDIVVDISTRAEDTIHGDAWYRFLLQCKYTIGVEGGASILDWDGSIRDKTNRYMADHPQAKFEDIEAACFPGLEGSLNLSVITPRHLEACATRTCQVLVEGEYNNVLIPETHYIKLDRDFSNIDEVFSRLSDDGLRARIVDAVYRDIIISGKYSYTSFAQQTIGLSLDGYKSTNLSLIGEPIIWLVWKWSRVTNMLAWVKCAFRGVILYPLYNISFRVLPAPLVSKIRVVARKVLKK